MKKTGIYKITSPSGKVYIGQSKDIKRRLYAYSSLGCKGQKKLYHSFVKHGYNKHNIEIVYEFPNDIPVEVLNAYEQFFIDQYREAGVPLLNIHMKASSFGNHSEETRRKIGSRLKGRQISEDQRMRHSMVMKGKPSPMKGKTHSEKVKEKIKIKRAQQKMPSGFKRNSPAWNKGLKGISNNWKGKQHSASTKEKIRLKLLGSKLSPETIAKRTATLKKNGVKRKWTDEAKRRQSERMTGKKLNPEQLKQ